MIELKTKMGSLFVDAASIIGVTMSKDEGWVPPTNSEEPVPDQYNLSIHLKGGGEMYVEFDSWDSLAIAYSRLKTSFVRIAA